MHHAVMIFPTDYAMHPAELAVEVESRGFESLWSAEHSHIPASRLSPWPGGDELPQMYYDAMDPFVWLTAAASATQTLKVAAGGKAKARWLLLVGIGDEKNAEKIAWKMGHAVASRARSLKSAAIELPEVSPESVRAASQGLVSGSYRYAEYKSDKAAGAALGSAVILGAPKGTRGLTAAVRAGKAIAESVNFARDLVNANRLGFSVDEIKAHSQKDERRRQEIGLVGPKRGQTTNPGTCSTEAE